MGRAKWNAIVMAIALSCASRAVALDQPGQQAVDLKSMSVAQLEKAGDTCRIQKDYEQAIQYFQEAVRRDRKNATLYQQVGTRGTAGRPDRPGPRGF